LVSPKLPKNEYIKFTYLNFGKIVIITNLGKFLSLDLNANDDYNAPNIVLDLKQEVKHVHDLKTKIVIVLKNKLLIINKL